MKWHHVMNSWVRLDGRVVRYFPTVHWTRPSTVDANYTRGFVLNEPMSSSMDEHHARAAFIAYSLNKAGL